MEPKLKSPSQFSQSCVSFDENLVSHIQLSKDSSPPLIKPDACHVSSNPRTSTRLLG
ncbi:unnamed protein product [Trichogramma brassicae]|uniref:Uncharacterized protein n=1 Tax=Trichogramma brassicae TaxID=86971 RepID=A0A6H5J3N7_9HYME|nr:unnamed protein product [Trichogramma brassicae]